MDTEGTWTRPLSRPRLSPRCWKRIVDPALQTKTRPAHLPRVLVAVASLRGLFLTPCEPSD